jgi:CHASE2 domain-containing sensor protein
MRKFWLDCLITTLFTFAVMAGLYSITQLKIFDAFDPLAKAFGDMEIFDITFSQLREDPEIDTSVVIVNIGYLSRGEIGQQIMNLNQFNPKVIALDIMFTCNGMPRDPENCPQAFDTLSNMMFAEAVRQAGPRMVMAEKLHQSPALVDSLGDAAVYDSIEHTDSNLLQNAYEGFVNLETDAEHQEDLKVCRTLNPKIIVNNKPELAFSTRIAWVFDSVKTKKYLDREKYSETINYRGNIVDWHGASSFSGRYAVLDAEQALDTSTFDGRMIKDKIVILGFLGADLRDTSWDDKFITPLNKNYAGKTRPDMYGVVIHANAVSMILNEDYINELETWQEYALAFAICLLNVALFSIINRRAPLWFDALTVIAQLAQIMVLTIFMLYLFNWIEFKLNLTLTLAAIALVGTCFELYQNVFKGAAYRIKRPWATVTKKNEEVLTPLE